MAIYKNANAMISTEGAISNIPTPRFLETYYESQPSKAVGLTREQSFRNSIVTCFRSISKSVDQQLCANTETLRVSSNRDSQIKAYSEILMSLVAMHQEFTDFLQACWTFDGFATVSGDDHRSVAAATLASEEWARTGLKEEVLQPQAFDSIVTAEFVSSNRNDLKDRLIADCDQHKQKFAVACLQKLTVMAAQHAIGVFDWYSGSTCRYSFFSRSVISKSTGTDRLTRFSEEFLAYTGTTKRQLLCHEHHLINAYISQIGNTNVALPHSVSMLVEATPKWLVSELRVIAGDIILELVSVEESELEKWTVLEQVPRMRKDPALVFGPFVLAGWIPEPVAPTSEDVHLGPSKIGRALWKIILGQ